LLIIAEDVTGFKRRPFHRHFCDWFHLG
jgi:hypothetical protein